jgi:hypothetical protein
VNDWQVGDLALCVADAPCACCGTPTAAVAGRVYRVTDYYLATRGFWCLSLEGVHPITNTKHWRGINAARFRKIRPDELEACEPEFVTLLKRTKHKTPALIERSETLG